MHRLPLRCSLRTLLTIMLAACCFLGGRTSRDQEVVEWQGKLRELEEDAERLEAWNEQLKAGFAYDVPDMMIYRYTSELAGAVTAVSDRELAEINVGLDDGVREGMTFDLWRGETWTGSGSVRKVTANRAVIMNRGPQAWMARKGDRAVLKYGLTLSLE